MMPKWGTTLLNSGWSLDSRRVFLEKISKYNFYFTSNSRPYQVNPENYDAKMRFWKETIKNYCYHKGSCDVTIAELKQAFKRKNTSPYCLQIVIQNS